MSAVCQSPLPNQRLHWQKRDEISWDIIGRQLLVVGASALDSRVARGGDCFANVSMIVHCRRRKIRCLLAPDDAQNRCSNCIRLKKECNFYPVDQQPPVERRPRAGSKVDGRSGDTSASSSSSPSMTTGHGIDQVDQYGQYPIVPIGSHSYSGPVVGLGTTTMSPPGSAGQWRVVQGQV